MHKLPLQQPLLPKSTALTPEQQQVRQTCESHAGIAPVASATIMLPAAVQKVFTNGLTPEQEEIRQMMAGFAASRNR